jgi:CBS domain-containing protein
MASRLKSTKEADKVWRRAIVPVDSTIGKVIHNLNDFGIKVVLVVDNANRLVGTISDGDIRRG